MAKKEQTPSALPTPQPEPTPAASPRRVCLDEYWLAASRAGFDRLAYAGMKALYGDPTLRFTHEEWAVRLERMLRSEVRV